MESLADGKDAGFRRIGLGDRREEIQEKGVLFLLFVAGHLFQVHIFTALQQQRQRPFDHRSLEQQHSFYVGMLNDRNRGMGWIFFLYQPPLFSYLGIGERGVVGGCGHGGSAHAHADSGFVHHLEHVFKPVVGLSHQISPAIVPVPYAELGDGASPVTQFVKNPRSNHVVGNQFPLSR